MDRKITKDFYDEISGYRDLNHYLEENEHKFIEEPLHGYLNLILKAKNYTKKDLIKSAGIEKSYLYQIFNGRRTPSRDKLIRIAMAMKLTLEDTQRLLIIAEKSILFPARKRDAALMFCLIKGCSLDKAQLQLYELEFEILE